MNPEQKKNDSEIQKEENYNMKTSKLNLCINIACIFFY